MQTDTLSLKALIARGADDCASGNGQSLYAAIYMAYHAGISEGDLRIRNNWRSATDSALTNAASEPFRHVAARHIPHPPPPVVNPECREFMAFEFTAA